MKLFRFSKYSRLTTSICPGCTSLTIHILMIKPAGSRARARLGSTLSYSESCHLSLASYLHHCSPPSLCCSFPGCCSTLALSASAGAAVLQAGPGVLYGCGATKPGPGPHDVTHCSSVVTASPAPPTSSLQSWLSSPLSFLHTPIQIKIMAHWKIYF